MFYLNHPVQDLDTYLIFISGDIFVDNTIQSEWPIWIDKNASTHIEWGWRARPKLTTH